MFDFSFTELLVVGAVALVVLGPEKLPKVARTVGHLVGRLQRYVNDVKRDINREVELDELRRLRAEMDEAARSVESSARDHLTSVRGEFDAIGKDVEQLGAGSAAAAADAGLTDPATRVAANTPAEPTDAAPATSAEPEAVVPAAETSAPSTIIPEGDVAQSSPERKPSEAATS